MDLYLKKQHWKRLLLVGAVIIGFVSLTYTNSLVKQVSYEEQDKVQRWAESVRMTLTQDSLSDEVSRYIYSIIISNKTVPILVVDEDEQIVANNNFKYSEKNKDKVLQREYQKLKSKSEPIVIDLGPDEKQYLYYKESLLLRRLRYYPFFQLSVIVLFILIAYYAFSSARKAEQNMVWIGMAKETAHQLGTPISSLMGWVEILKDMEIDEHIALGVEKDTDRLARIAERFSKVGSTPELYPENLYAILDDAVDYLKSRIPKNIEITSLYTKKKDEALYIHLSGTLFGWVIENLIRNSVDALSGSSGRITVNVFDIDDKIAIEVADNGKGIPKSKQKNIFKPGFTTKKRGWGLGLTLSKRIIENYHKGKIFLKYSEPNKGTAFQIILKKANPGKPNSPK